MKPMSRRWSAKHVKELDSEGNKKEALADYYSTLESVETLQETNSRTFGFGQKLRPTTHGEPVPMPVSKTPAIGENEKKTKRVLSGS